MVVDAGVSVGINSGVDVTCGVPLTALGTVGVRPIVVAGAIVMATGIGVSLATVA